MPLYRMTYIYIFYTAVPCSGAKQWPLGSAEVWSHDLPMNNPIFWGGVFVCLFFLKVMTITFFPCLGFCQLFFCLLVIGAKCLTHICHICHHLDLHAHFPSHHNCCNCLFLIRWCFVFFWLFTPGRVLWTVFAWVLKVLRLHYNSTHLKMPTQSHASLYLCCNSLICVCRFRNICTSVKVYYYILSF